MRPSLPFATLLGVAFLLGCQEQASSPVGLEDLGPQFGGPQHPGPHGGGGGGGGGGGDDDPGSLFNSPGTLGTGFTCAGGAEITGGDTFGKVKWSQLRDDTHVHANVLLRDVEPGLYLFFGNQKEVCDVGTVDFDLRSPGHAISVMVGNNRKAKARIGLTFGTNDRNVGVPAAHAPGPHKLWLTITGPEGILRSTAVVVVIPAHAGHP